MIGRQLDAMRLSVNYDAQAAISGGGEGRI
jgi:hypothetical protein